MYGSCKKFKVVRSLLVLVLASLLSSCLGLKLFKIAPF